MFYSANGKKYSLDESPDLLIIRTKNNIHPEIIINSVLTNYPNVSYGAKPIVFPEASVFVYQFSGADGDDLTNIKLAINDEKPTVKFAGSVLVNSKTGAYQIYTGNMFLKFKDDFDDIKCSQLLSEYQLYPKRKLGFCKNGYFVQPFVSIGRKIFDLADQLSSISAIEICEPEIVVKRKTFEEDHLMPRLDNNELSSDLNWVRDMIKLDQAHKISKGKGVVICIIDDGIDLGHVAFSGNKIVKAIDLLNEEGNGAHVFDSEMHGTACASIACSADPKTLGTAPDASLMVIRTKGLGSVLEAEAIYQAVDRGADIISCSWGPPDGNITDPDDNETYHPMPDHTRMAINYAITKGRKEKGCLIFFAAGNGAEPMKYDGYASNDYVMAIGAVDKDKKLTAYSDFGHPLFCCFPSSQIMVKDGDIHINYGLTTVDRVGKLGYDDSDYYTLFGGTSASAPGMAGIAALMLATDPSLTFSDAKYLLSKSCRDQNNEIAQVPSDKYGWGIIDAHLLLNNTMEAKNKNTPPKNNDTMKMYALHVALNEVDNEIYKGIYADLNGCIKDSESYQNLASNYDSRILYNSQATREGFERELKILADKANAGDKVLITYAGHGSFVDDLNGDEVENNGFDETLVLYNGLWIDDETNRILGTFDEGVDVLMIVDSCHSGSIARTVTINIPENDPESRIKVRGLSIDKVRKIYQADKAKYDERWGKRNNKSRQSSLDNVKCNVISLSACQDNEFANETPLGGEFTLAIISLLNEGNKLTAEKLIQEASIRIKNAGVRDQNPNDEYYGPDSSKLKETTIEEFFTPKQETHSKPNDEPKPVSHFKFYSTGYVDTEDDTVSIDIRDDASARGTVQEGMAQAWDSTYIEYFKSDRSQVYEPELISADHVENVEAFESRKKKDPDAYLDNYENPQPGDENKFSWHLGDDFTQLAKAFKAVCPESEIDNPHPANHYPLIAHIDTGILTDHPSIPQHYNEEKSKAFRNPVDRDWWLYPGEQQGHGHATATILAGQHFCTDLPDNEVMPRFIGAFPYAQVVSLRISDSVVILSGKSFVKAVKHAIKQKVDVITMSMAGAPTKRMVNVINEAYEAGIIIVSAGGNSWTKGVKKLLPKSLMYPARFNRVIAAVGVQHNHTPYLVDVPKARAEGGEHMQSCYGPPSAMRTAIAAYSPNISWMHNVKNKKYVRTGGGTSSATPQIAAAAALFIHKHRAEIDALVTKPSEKWKKVEIVRKALFNSARKYTGYDDFYGNGILQAYDMLHYDVKNEGKNLVKEAEDSLGGAVIDDLVKMWTVRRSSDGQSDAVDQNLSEMVALELEHLMIMDDDINIHGREVDISPILADKIIKSPYASQFLKSLMASKASKETRSSGVVQDTLQPFHTICSEDYGEIQYFANAHLDAHKIEVHEKEADYVEAAFEINMDDYNGTRSSTIPDQMVAAYMPQKTAPLQLVEATLEDGSVIRKWIFADEEKIVNSLRSARSEFAYIPAQLQLISLNSIDADGQRGFIGWLKSLPGKVEKVIVKVVRTIKKQSISGLDGLIMKTASGHWKEIDKSIKLDTKKKTLLLIHGTWSSTEGSFDDFFGGNCIYDKLKANGYNNTILGFDMDTIRTNVVTNADDLKTQLKPLNLDYKNVTVLAFSRGGLVAKEVFNKNEAKIFFSASTLRGTPMADKENITKLLKRATILSSFVLPASPFLTGLFKLGQYLADGIFSLPGISDQAPGSKLITAQQKKFKYNPNLHFFIATDYEPCKVLKQLKDFTSDELIFSGLANDGVTPTLDSLFLNPGDVPLPAGNSKNSYLISNRKINHFNIFKDGGALEHFVSNM